jgi:hypothetical protein
MAAQIHFLVMGAMLLLALAVFERKRYRAVLPIVFIVFVVAGLMQLPWILPLAENSGSTNVLNSQSFLDYHEMTSSPSLWESFRMVGYNIHSYGYKQLADVGVIPGWAMVLDVSFVVVAFSALVFKRNRYTVPMAALLIIGIFLAKGISEPGRDIFIFLFENTPLILFREIWHIVFIPIFAGTVLIGFALGPITSWFSKKIERRPWRRWKKGAVSYVPAVAIASLIIVTNGYPMLRGDFAGYMQTYEINDDYEGLISQFADDPGSYRIYWLPSNQPMGYEGVGLAGVDPVIANSPKATNPAEVFTDREMSRYNMWIVTALQHNSTSNIGNLMSIADNKYVVLREDFISQYANYVDASLYPELYKYWDAQLLNNNTLAQGDLIVVDDAGNYILFQNTQDPGFAYLQSRMVVGSADLGVLTHLSGELNLTDIGYVTSLDQLRGIDAGGLLFITKDDPNDVMDQIAGASYNPGDYTDTLNPHRGWTAGRVWFWYDPLLADSTNDGALAIDDQSMDMTIQGKAGGELWAKVLCSNMSGSIQFLLDGRDVGAFNVNTSAHYLKWIKVCDLNSSENTTLTIHSLNETNYVDQIMVVDGKDLSTIEERLSLADVVDLLTPNGYTRGPNVTAGPRYLEIPEGSWASRDISVLKAGDRVAWVTFTGNISVRVDGVSFNLTSMSETTARVDLGAWAPGDMSINITAQADSTLGDMWISTDTISGSLSEMIARGGTAAPVVAVEELSTTKWKVTVNLTEPTMLAFAMPYDSGWVAIVNGHTYSSIALYTILNGFWINETGELTIQIVYMPQQTFELGMDLAFITIGGSLIMIAVQFIRPEWWSRLFKR